MEKEFNEIFDSNIPHGTFLSRRAVMNCIEQAYILGKNTSKTEFDVLKSSFESLLELYADFGKYNSSREHLIEDWKSDAGLINKTTNNGKEN